MASAAQTFANQANAQHSTGPRTEEGKARSSRNNFQHGLTLGVLAIEDHEREAHARLAEELRQQIQPNSNLEEEAYRQILDGAWRLNKVHALLDALFTEYNGDPFSRPEAVARINTLRRYRAAAEMLLYRGVKEIRDLQTQALDRLTHFLEFEKELVPPLVKTPKSLILTDLDLRVADRQEYYSRFGAGEFIYSFSEEGMAEIRTEADFIRTQCAKNNHRKGDEGGARYDGRDTNRDTAPGC